MELVQQSNQNYLYLGCDCDIFNAQVSDLTITIMPIKEMQECDFENLYFVFYVEKIVAGQVSLILSSKGLNHNLKISPPAPRIFLLDSTTWFLYLKKNPDGKSRNAIQRQ